MNANEKKLEKWEKKLVKAGLLIMGEHIIDVIAGDYHKRSRQIRGHIVFTNNKLIFCGRFMGYIVPIEYYNVQSIHTCLIGPFPLGLRVTALDSNTNAYNHHILALFHRNHWKEFIESKRASYRYR